LGHLAFDSAKNAESYLASVSLLFMHFRELCEVAERKI